MNVLIAVPTHQLAMKSPTSVVVADVVRLLTERGIDASIRVLDSYDVVTARDLFAKAVLDEGFDALLFIDSDMQFDAKLILRMIDKGGDVIGAA